MYDHDILATQISLFAKHKLNKHCIFITLEQCLYHITLMLDYEKTWSHPHTHGYTLNIY